MAVGPHHAERIRSYNYRMKRSPARFGVILAVGVLALVSQDGESNRMEGVLLLGVYLILALAFYHRSVRAVGAQYRTRLSRSRY